MTQKIFFRCCHVLILAAFCLLSPKANAGEILHRDVVTTSPEEFTCNITIVGNVEPECILPLEKDWYYNEEPNILIACQGMTVTYTAYADMGGNSPDSWTWEVAGAVSYSDHGNGSITVTWGEGSIGQLTVTVYGPNGISCTKTVNVRLIEKPHINVVTTPAYVESPGGPKIIYVCQGETVEFTELSSTTNTDIVGYYWESMMGGTSSTPNYRIENVWANDQVIHRVYNNCGCYDEEVYEIQVLTGDILDLGCYGTVCEGARVTYTANSPSCNQFFWYVEGGTIVDGQSTPQVTVQWDNPQNGYGVIAIDGNLCGNTACPAMLSKKIPIIENNLSIKGQTTACVDEAVIYSIPLFGSTKYHWSITPSSGVSQVAVNGANEQMYIFTTPGTYQITVSYKCDFLECGEFQSEPLTVVVKPKFSITGEDRICITNLCNLSTSPVVVANWNVYDMDNGNQFVASYSSLSNLSVSYPHPGKYLITAENNNFCRAAEFILNVQDAPPAPSLSDLDPNNPHTACPYDGVRLQAHPQNPNYTIVWQPTCTDATPNQRSGNDVTINYGATVCNINAYTYDKMLNCMSATAYIQQIAKLEPALLDTARHKSVCPGTTLPLSAPYQDGVLYEWTIQDNMQRCASVQGSHLENSIDLTVHELTSGIYGYDFYVVLKRTVCHVDYYDTFYIHVNDHSPTNLSLSANPLTACPNEIFTFTGTGGDPTTYRWRVDGRLVSFIGNPYTCSFSTPGPHYVTLLYNEMDECTNLNYYDSATVSVLVHPAPVINGIDYDAPTQTVSVDMASGTYTYQWYYNGVLLVGETNSYMTTIGNGTYQCEVTNSWGCKSSESKYIGPSTPSNVCDLLAEMDTTYDFCNSELHLISPVSTPPTINWSCSGSSSQRTLTVNTSDRHYATVKFHDVGIYYIKSYTSGSGCEVSKITHIERFIPDFSFEKQCDKIIIHNNSRSLSGIEHIYFTVAGHNSCDFDFSTKTYEYPISSNGTYTFTLSIYVDGKHYSCVYPSIVFNTINNTTLTINSANTINPHLTCNNTPIELTVTPTPYFPITATTWIFGDGSRFTEVGNSISHTFGVGSNYPVSATVIDPNGCPVTSSSFILQSNTYSLNNAYLDTLGSMVCPNTARLIEYKQTPTSIYYWNGSLSSSSNSLYSTFNTGLYSAIAVNNSYCHAQDNINVKFKNKPTAIIVTEKQKYCLGEKVMLYGATGPDSNDCTYQWDVTNLNNNSITHFYTATASFVPSAAGNYQIDLCITNTSSGCFDCANPATITVYSTPVAPSIGFGSRLCMDDPPVELVGSSPVTTDLHWSNGSMGTTAYYFTPGVATSWYYDPTSGCKSNEAHITIEAQPNFDAMLTGCYEKCPEYFRNNPHLPVWGLTTWMQDIDWKWYLDGSSIDAGSGNYTYNPLMLPLVWFGKYNLDVDYNNNNCHVSSPLLTITEKEACDCENVDITTKTSWYVKECHIFYDINVTVCNNSDLEDCFKDLKPLFESEYMNVVWTDFGGATLAPGDCFSFNILLEVSQFIPSQTAVFQLFDECNNCTTDFSIDLMPEKIECEMEMQLEWFEIRPDLSSNVAAYFDFKLDVSPCQNLIAFWTEPPMVINYWYDGAATVYGLGMVDFATLTQLMAESGEICFYAITCEGDKLCKRRVCISAEEVYNILHDMGLAKTNTSGGSKGGNTKRMPNPDLGNDTDPRLMPNPTTGEVNVIGTTDEVVEVLVMDMNGRQMATFDNTSNFNISTLSSGIYIVRVKTHRDNTEKVTYLKLVKK